MAEIVLLVVGAVLGVIASVALQEPLQIALTRLLGGIGPLRGSSLKGTWRSTYTYRSGGHKREITQVMEMRQIGPFVVGRCRSSSGPHRHLIRGRVRDRVFTGVWHNVAPNAGHRGGIQLLIDPDGQGMNGKWIGFDRRHSIQHGDWTWQLIAPALADKDVRRQLPGARAQEGSTQP